MTDTEVLIKNLKMIAHPEGGHFSESFRDESNNVSLIYYMLQKNEWSHWHRLTKNEILHFYKGDPLTIYISKDGIDFTSVTIGENDNFHFIVKANKLAGVLNRISEFGARVEACQYYCQNQPHNFE